MDGDQSRPAEGRGAVQIAGPEPAQPRQWATRSGHDAEDDRDGQQRQCDDAGAPAERPECGVERGLVHAATSDGQSPTRTTRCRWSTSRAVCPRSASQRGASRPRTIAAVAAVLASVQVGAATVALRQTGAAGAAVRGSTTWWIRTPPRRQVRRTVEEVATAHPEARVTWQAGPRRRRAPAPAIRRPVAVPPSRGLLRARPARRRRWSSAARRASRSAARAFAVAPRSSETAGGSSRRSPRRWTRRHPGTDVTSCTGGPSAGRSSMLRSYPQASSAPPIVGSTRPPLASAASRRRADEVGQQRREPMGPGRQRGELGVGPEARAGTVDRRRALRERSPRPLGVQQPR